MREPWWWLSFADADRPEGEQFLGGLFLRGHTLPAVITESHLRDLNPGGEVEATELPPEIDVPAKWAERLLSPEEIAEMDREMGSVQDLRVFLGAGHEAWTDEQLAEAIREAKQIIGGRRLSWKVVAAKILRDETTTGDSGD